MRCRVGGAKCHQYAPHHDSPHHDTRHTLAELPPPKPLMWPLMLQPLFEYLLSRAPRAVKMTHTLLRPPSAGVGGGMCTHHAGITRTHTYEWRCTERTAPLTHLPPTHTHTNTCNHRNHRSPYARRCTDARSTPHTTRCSRMFPQPLPPHTHKPMHNTPQHGVHSPHSHQHGAHAPHSPQHGAHSRMR